MLPGYGPITQTIFGTLFTWGLTAAGASLVVVIHGKQRKLLDTSLGFAGGVMIAASYWSLLAPAIEMAEESKNYGENGEYAVIPIAIGFFLGCLFVFITDLIISKFGLHSASFLLADQITKEPAQKKYDFGSKTLDDDPNCLVTVHSNMGEKNQTEVPDNTQWKRILLLLIAITVHNIPEGIVVGVGFAAIGSSPSATFQNARNLAIGIGIQNFPEGLAVSLPLHAAGYSTWTSFWFGQLSGMVEPVFGILGAFAVTMAKPLLPYALSFAAGAMVYVVFDDIVPEAHASGNGRLATWGAIIGFLIMMSLDVGLG